MEQALTQLVKSCEMAMSSAVLLASENEKLQIENQCQKKKKAIRRTYIAKGGVLSGAEGLSCTQAAETEQQKAAAEQLQRAPRKCSMCSSTEHTARTCSLR
jgi:hypothetical protein